MGENKIKMPPLLVEDLLPSNPPLKPSGDVSLEEIKRELVEQVSKD